MPIPHTYRVIGKIGAGNSGEIYKAYQINLGKYVEMTTNIDNIMDAFAAIRDKNIMKVVVHPQE